jgi:hypothetical protein
MKVKVVPVGKRGALPCFSFASPRLREAFKTLSGRSSASATKLAALNAFGVKIIFEDVLSPTTNEHAIQEPS